MTIPTFRIMLKHRDYIF